MNLGARTPLITGLGTINALGNNVAEFWSSLESGTSGVRRLRNIDVGDYPIAIGAEIDFPEPATVGLSKKELRRFDRYIMLAFVAAREAVADAGIADAPNKERIGVVIGTGEGGLGTHEKNIPLINEKGMQAAPPYYVVGCIPNTGAAFAAIKFGFKGPNFSVNSACASSNHAMGMAKFMLEGGLCDVCVVGGAEAVVTPVSIAAFGNIGALAPGWNDRPEQASRPFDRDRNGFVMGEGAGALILEAREHAEARGAKVYGALTGFGCSADAHDFVAPDPSSIGIQRAMTMAMEQAGVEPGDIGLINAHATATVAGDIAESRAVGALFGDHRPWVQSTKSMTGHLIGAAGAVEAIAAILAFEKGIVHPTINCPNMDPEIDVRIAATATRDDGIRHVMSNGFGFGGQNATVIISRV